MTVCYTELQRHTVFVDIQLNGKAYR